MLRSSLAFNRNALGNNLSLLKLILSLTTFSNLPQLKLLVMVVTKAVLLKAFCDNFISSSIELNEKIIALKLRMNAKQHAF